MSRRTTTGSRSTLFLLFLLLLTLAASASAGTGGYTMLTSADPGGPSMQWIDISATGTLVTGLADDNSAASMTALPQNFRYFGTDFGSVKIGSNGWVAFTNVSNIASCFPTIPTAGGAGDAYMAPLMADLNFTGAGNPGTVRSYDDAANGRFVVSYINVPYWSVNAPGYSGSTTFQVVLEFATGIVRFNYSSLTAAIFNAACNDVTVGIEGPGGTDGLEYTHDAMIPSTPFSIVFTPPGEVEVTPTSGLVTTEGGATATFDVVLALQPAANVVIPVSSSDTTEGTASTTSLTFTPADWDVPQTVTVTGVDDLAVDGPIAYSIVLGAASSTAANYNGVDPADVSVTNEDDDVPAGPTVAKSFEPVSIRSGWTAALTVTLSNPNTAPILGVAFTDLYPDGLANASAPAAATTCGGTVTALPGGASVALAGGTIPASGWCTVTVPVIALLPGSYVNIIPDGAVTSANSPASGGGASSAALDVLQPVPALSRPGLALMAVLLGAAAWLALRRA